MQASYDIKIPKERVAVLIGVKGIVKKNLQKATETIIDVDSSEGLVTVSGEDALKLMDARSIIKAIARGFNPELAMLLLKQDYCFELIDLKLIARNQNDLERLKGRIIGADGKSRRTIETLTETYISVYGKTVALIGEITMVQIAKKAVALLVDGSAHSHVFKYLETQRRKLKQQDFESQHKGL